MGILWPHSNSIIRTNTDTRAAGAKIYFFEAGTTTPRTTYSDAALTTPRTHPVVADAYGRAPAIFLDFGDYRERVRTSGDTTLWDTDNIPNPAPTDPGAGVDANSIFQTGDIILAGKNGTRDGFVRCNGRTIGSAISGATERANPDTEALFAYLWNNYANGQAAVSTGRGASAVADFAANKTIELPDFRAGAPAGFDDMGNLALTGYGSAPVVKGSGILAGSILGSPVHTLTAAQLPVTTPAGTINQVTGTIAPITPAGTIAPITPAGTITVNDTHTHTVGNPGALFLAQVGSGGIATLSGGAANISNAATTNTASPAITATFTGTQFTPAFTGTQFTPVFTGSTPTFTGTSFGSGALHNNMQRTNPVTFLMKL